MCYLRICYKSRPFLPNIQIHDIYPHLHTHLEPSSCISTMPQTNFITKKHTLILSSNPQKRTHDNTNPNHHKQIENFNAGPDHQQLLTMFIKKALINSKRNKSTCISGWYDVADFRYSSLGDDEDDVSFCVDLEQYSGR